MNQSLTTYYCPFQLRLVTLPNEKPKSEFILVVHAHITVCFTNLHMVKCHKLVLGQIMVESKCLFVDFHKGLISSLVAMLKCTSTI